MDNTKMSPLEEGYVLQGKKHSYTIQKMLGRGGFGITYFAEETVYEGNIPQRHEFAIKEFFMSDICSRAADRSIVIPEASADDVEAARQEFIREAERLHAMSHKGIVPVNEIIYANNTVYYVMQHLGNCSLTRYVKDCGGRLDESAAKKIIRQVAEAVGYLHQQRVTHLDIKPDNIMIVDPQGEAFPVLIDFGLAGHYKSNGRLTSKMSLSGVSEGYSPIEQYVGIDTFTPQADIYALGATLFFMLSGSAPVKASAISNRYIYANLPDAVSDSTGHVVASCMQKLKEQRVQSIDALLALLDGNPSDISVDPLSSSGGNKTQLMNRNSRGAMDKRWLYGVAAAAIVAVALLLFLLLKGGGEADNVAQPASDTLETSATATQVAEEPAVAGESPEPAVQEEPQKEESAQPTAANGGGGQQSQTQQSSGRTEGSVSSSGSSGRNPSWGRYEGGRNSEGLPHGNGVVRITRSTTLNGESVGSGDRIEGLFRNGYLNFGTLYKANGEEVKLKDVNLF